MKPLKNLHYPKSLFVFLLMSVTYAASAQTIRIADNSASKPTGANIFATLQAAIDAAAVGDIVYVQPTITSYGDVTINKQITLRGIGFNTGKDIPLQSYVGNIGLTNNVANSSNASGTSIEGVNANAIYLGLNNASTGSYTLQNITISNCQMRDVTNGIRHDYGYMNMANITIQNCRTAISFYGYPNNASTSNLFVYQNYLYGIYFEYGSLTSAIFSNNIIDNGNSNWFGNNDLAINNLIITNNNFLGEANVSGSFFLYRDLHDAIVSNNIFYGCAPTSTNASVYERNAFINNLTYGTTADALPPPGTGVGNTGIGNLVAQDPKFVSAPYNTAWTSAFDFTLQSGSPAKNAGSDGTDIGITGGAYPVSVNIINKATSVPIIISLNPAAMVPQSQPVNTAIKAKSN